ncbi:MAG TPA: pre-peptidase C-terminal domain-containing protein [Kofleriaceae bacterium]
MLQQVFGSCSRSFLIGVTCLASAVACGPSTSPQLIAPGDQVAQVGTELVLMLTGKDPDGDKLTYSYSSRDTDGLDRRAAIATSESGTGVFRWTPTSADIGSHAIDFTASDGSHSAAATVNVDVRSSFGGAGPVFTAPVGDGQSVDLARSTCVDVEVAVTDPSASARVRLSQDEPLIDGGMLNPHDDGLSATWHWCPTRDQQAESRYSLVLGADDGVNPKLTKTYLIALDSGAGTSCPGTAPVVQSTPKDVSSIANLTITATVSDDKGIKDAPLLYYATTAPATPPDLSKMAQVAMTQTSGDRANGMYSASVPNPVAQLPAGSTQTVYYVIVAADDDDTMGTCDHTTTSSAYSLKVTATATSDEPICAACTTDAQCGANDECVRVGSAAYCLQACDGGCPTGYTCSATPVTSVDGKMAKQCEPDSGSCTMTTTMCTDDSWEVNDSRTDASNNPTMMPDTYDLVSCPSTTSATRANDDWFKIVTTASQRVDLQIAGDPVSDLDLHLYHSDGTVITASTSFDPDEEISTCLPAGTYYVKVNGFGHARNEYLMSYAATAEACNTSCTDDALEDDDTYSQARETTYPSYASTGNQICPADDDWYHVPLYTGDVMTVDLTFTQNNDQQDLDLHLYKSSVDLTPCSAADPTTCTIAHGQSGSSNEHTTFTAPAGCDAGCDYYVVVRGFDNSSNAYAIKIAVQ